MPRAVLEKLATVQTLEVHVPTLDGRELLLTRHTAPSADVALLLARLNLALPPQSRPRSAQDPPPRWPTARVVPTFGIAHR